MHLQTSLMVQWLRLYFQCRGHWCFQTVVLEKTLESPLDSREIKPVNAKENQSWLFIGRTDAEAETPILWHLMQRANSLEKTDAWERLRVGGEWGNRDKMIGWHHCLNGHKFEQTLGDSGGQGSLECLWGHKDSDTPKWLNNGELNPTCHAMWPKNLKKCQCTFHFSVLSIIPLLLLVR